MAKLTSSTAWLAVVDKAFSGNPRIKTGRPEVIVANAAPVNSTDAAPVGMLWLQMTANNLTVSNCWINTAAAGTWKLLN